MSLTSHAYLSSITQTLGIISGRLPGVVRHYPGSVVLASLLGFSTPWLVRNYNEFLAIGPGALPYNVFGWLIALALKSFDRETTSTQEYDEDPNEESFIEHPETISERKGTRPNSGWHVVPVRQFDQIPSPEAMARLDEVFARLAALNADILTVAKSPHERLHDGLLIHPSITSPHQVAKAGLREVGHIHPADHSMHVILAPQDCKLVIERKWGERHKLSGSTKLLPQLPKEYIWIYAPRDQEEFAVVEKILIASVGYMTNSKTVKY